MFLEVSGALVHLTCRKGKWEESMYLRAIPSARLYSDLDFIDFMFPQGYNVSLSQPEGLPPGSFRWKQSPSTLSLCQPLSPLWTPACHSRPSMYCLRKASIQKRDLYSSKPWIHPDYTMPNLVFGFVSWLEIFLHVLSIWIFPAVQHLDIHSCAAFGYSQLSASGYSQLSIWLFQLCIWIFPAVQHLDVPSCPFGYSQLHIWIYPAVQHLDVHSCAASGYSQLSI